MARHNDELCMISYGGKRVKRKQVRQPSGVRRLVAVVGVMSMLFTFTALPSTWSWYTGKITVRGASLTIGHITAATMSKTVSHTYTPYPVIDAVGEPTDEAAETTQEAPETETEPAAEQGTENEIPAIEEPVAEATEASVQNDEAPEDAAPVDSVPEDAVPADGAPADGEPTGTTEQSEGVESDETAPTEQAESEPETVTELYTQVCIAVTGTADRGYMIVTIDEVQYLVSETAPGDVIYFTVFGDVAVDAQAYPGAYEPGEPEALEPEAEEPLHNIDEEFEYAMADGVFVIPELSECFADYTVEHLELGEEDLEDFVPEYPELVFEDPVYPETQVPDPETDAGQDGEQTPAVSAEDQSADTEPADGEEVPTQPEEPVTPEIPAQPEEPVTPEAPAQPEEGTVHEDPAQPKEPETLEDPAQPEEPDTPETPAEPEEVTEREDPAQPETSTES